MLTCDNCDEELVIGARFCENCGQKVVSKYESSVIPCSCGSSLYDVEGFCQDCGQKQRLQVGETIIDVGFAAITDIGCCHMTNDDAFVIFEHEKADVLVICDGVSRSQTPWLGSVAASQTACEYLKNWLNTPVLDDSAAIITAIQEAHKAVCIIPYDRQNELDPPLTTIVVAAVSKKDDKTRITIGWLGDSRAYWITRTGGTQLTKDHSWRNAVVESGKFSDQEAAKDPRAHALIKCLGTTDITKFVPCPEISVVSYDIKSAEGWLLLATDGLYNYAETPLQLTLAANGLLWSSSAIEIARGLVTFAKEKGGHDNITVALKKIN